MHLQRSQVRCTVSHMGTNATQKVAAEVRAAIARKGLNASTVAAATDMTTSTLSLRLRGVNPFDVEELARIAAFLEVDVRDFFPRADRIAA